MTPRVPALAASFLLAAAVGGPANVLGATVGSRAASPALQELLGGKEPPRVPPAVAASPVRGLPGSASYEKIKALYEDATEAPTREELDGWFVGSEVSEPNGADYARVYPAVLIGTKRAPNEVWGLYRFICVACAGSEFREVRLPWVQRIQSLLAEHGPLYSPPSFTSQEVRFECSLPPQQFALRKSGRFIVEKGSSAGRPFYAVYYRDVTPGE